MLRNTSTKMHSSSATKWSMTMIPKLLPSRKTFLTILKEECLRMWYYIIMNPPIFRFLVKNGAARYNLTLWFNLSVYYINKIIHCCKKSIHFPTGGDKEWMRIYYFSWELVVYQYLVWKFFIKPCSLRYLVTGKATDCNHNKQISWIISFQNETNRATQQNRPKISYHLYFFIFYKKRWDR